MDIRVLNKTIPDFLFDLQGAGEAFEDMKQTGLSGEKLLGEAKTKAPNSDYHKDEPPVAGLRRADGRRAQEVQRGAGAGLRDGRVRGGCWGT